MPQGPHAYHHQSGWHGNWQCKSTASCIQVSPVSFLYNLLHPSIAVCHFLTGEHLQAITAAQNTMHLARVLIRFDVYIQNYPYILSLLKCGHHPQINSIGSDVEFLIPEEFPVLQSEMVAFIDNVLSDQSRRDWCGMQKETCPIETDVNVWFWIPCVIGCFVCIN